MPENRSRDRTFPLVAPETHPLVPLVSRGPFLWFALSGFPFIPPRKKNLVKRLWCPFQPPFLFVSFCLPFRKDPLPFCLPFLWLPLFGWFPFAFSLPTRLAARRCSWPSGRRWSPRASGRGRCTPVPSLGTILRDLFLGAIGVE